MMNKAAMVFLCAMTLSVGCRCGDDPCDRDERGDDRGHRWGRHHDRDREDEDEREVCEEDGGSRGNGSDAGGAAASDARGVATSDAGGGGAGDAGAAADSCVHPAP